MSSQFTLSKVSEETALDYQQLYTLGLKHVQDLARQIWTDYNIHDPGITTLELLCYALTDLSYRATSPIQDLLAGDNPTEIKEQFFTACQIFPNRPLTLLDYRKLLIDIEGVENAWLQPTTQIYYADPVKGKLFLEKPPNIPDVKVNVHGLYDVLIEYKDENIETVVKDRLKANRNLCEDFVNFKAVEIQEFILCGKLEVIPNADVEKVKAEILFKIQQYLSPSIHRYSLSEMLTRKKADGTPLYTVDEIFDGPTLENGFIDDEELKNAELRKTIRLSDVINLIMDIKEVQAVQDILINPLVLSKPLENKWIIPVAEHKKPYLNCEQSNLIFYKRNKPVITGDNKIEEQQLITTRLLPPEPNDLEVPLGKSRQVDTYYSFQNHFPAVYGLSEIGLEGAADDHRKALAYQLKAYLLFFDQIMANYLAQLNHVKALFSTDPDLESTYFCQIVNSFVDYKKIYGTGPEKDYAIHEDSDIQVILDEIKIEEKSLFLNRRHRFLDHLIARFAEKFHDLAYTLFKPEEAIQHKCEFLDNYPTLSSRRLLAYNYSDKNLWNTHNVSGLEKRLASLLGIKDYTRRDLSGDEEGMYLIENILLRPEQNNDPFLPIRPNPNYTTDYPEFDPYSYRIHIILPAYAGRFNDMNFRRFAEEVVREETPAHVLPKICWISREDMVELQKYYREWLSLKAGEKTEPRQEILANFINKLFTLRNSYPSHSLHECDGENKQFILGQTRLGTEKGE